MSEEFYDANCTNCARLAARVRELEAWAQGVVNYETKEVCKDEFAYDRLLNNIKSAASKALHGK